MRSEWQHALKHIVTLPGEPHAALLFRHVLKNGSVRVSRWFVSQGRFEPKTALLCRAFWIPAFAGMTEI